MASYKGEKGQPPYHPAMMVALLLYAYAVGIYSSRRIAKARAGGLHGDRGARCARLRTISEFRRRHLAALSALFVQVLKLCERAGLVKLGHVALDGTKIMANASKHKAMSYERVRQREAELQGEVDGWLKARRRRRTRRLGRTSAAIRCRTGAPTMGDRGMHWLLDVEFGDDLSRYRTGYGAKNMAIVRRFALGLVRANKRKGSVKTRRKRKLGPQVPARNPPNQIAVNLDSVP